MAAPLGNQFWKARSKHGRNKIFSDDDVLWEACQEYFQWVVDNPLQEEKVFCHQGNVTKTSLDKMRAMTIGGLCTFLDIDQTTWTEYKKHKDFSSVCTRVEQIIKDQKFAGAAADMLNPSIIARDLGLADKTDSNVKASYTINLSETDAEL
ncbi:terminase small subunit [Sulfurovum sp.]|uniref:terminase small subunit n=1 Tax=Sulfurovum sp. TaxID=1969726 RepID=UPI0035634310